MIEPNPKSATPAFITPSVFRRLASMLYEMLVLGAVLFIAALIFILLRNPQAPGAMPFFQAYLLLVMLGYFSWFWTHGGQTVAMRAWRFRVEGADGRPLRFAQAGLRFVLAWFSVFSVAGLLWAWFDHDRKFLHDRLARTRLVMC
ncbi:MAG: RDD family protein [Hydrogenophilales bacterium]|nr:RDD family protein [Hydrogenophilales bacterium]